MSVLKPVKLKWVLISFGSLKTLSPHATVPGSVQNINRIGYNYNVLL